MGRVAGQDSGEDADERGSLSPELELVAQLLADGQSDAGAALAVGRAAKFVQRARRSTPAFVVRVQELKQYRAEQTAAGLGALLEKAVGAVERGLHAEKPADQLRAAALVFDRYPRFAAETEGADRIHGLEAEIDELRGIVASLRVDRSSAGSAGT